MKRLPCQVLIMLFLAISGAAQAAGEDGGSQPITSTLHSAILNEDRTVIIHLPRNYALNATDKYPVMYVLDGTSQDQHTADKITVLADAGLVPDAIVVGIPNTRGNRERDQTPPFMKTSVDDANSPLGRGDRFLAFLEKELIPFIDSKYRTSGLRTLTGNSRGGLLVLYSLFEKPNLFQARFCYSTPVWRFEDMMIKKMVEFLRSPTHVESFLFMSAGAKENEGIVGGLARVTDALKKNKKQQLKWATYSTPHAVHGNNARISTSKGLVEWGAYLKTNGKSKFKIQT
ncbi:MAG TPA: alpha/beta hydrolase-fold protein [Pyrinomonadaceae bacterium]